MINTHNRVPVYAYGAPADLRKQFNGLSGLVRNEMKKAGIRLLSDSRVTEIRVDGHIVKAAIGDNIITAVLILFMQGVNAEAVPSTEHARKNPN